MVDENQEDVGTDLIRFHRSITRSLEVIIKNVEKYLEIGTIEDEKREGFLKYIQSFSVVIDLHHLHEDEKVFPYVIDKLPDAPYDRLITQHKWVKTLLTEINGEIKDLKSNGDQFNSLSIFKTDFKQIDKIWHPHIRIEEERIFEKIGRLNLSLEETNRLREEFYRFFMEHSEPLNLVMPFVLYNLEKEDRVIQAQQFPEIVTKIDDWKDEWESMEPFLLK